MKAQTPGQIIDELGPGKFVKPMATTTLTRSTVRARQVEAFAPGWV